MRRLCCLISKCFATVAVVLVFVNSYSISSKGQFLGCSKQYDVSDDYRVIYSDNYPFDVTGHRTCEYVIFVHQPTLVCLNFYKFELETNAHEDAYVEISNGELNVKYAGNGDEFSDTPSSKAPDRLNNVFNEDFCWYTWQNVTLRFVVNSTYLVGTGFYLEFEGTANINGFDSFDPELSQEQSESIQSVKTYFGMHKGVNIKKNKACSEYEWKCFNVSASSGEKQCIPRYQKCDGYVDCADGSDETYVHARCFQDNGYTLEACDFSRNACGLKGFGESWQLISHKHDGPYTFFDHTYNNQNGLFAVTNLQLLPQEAYIFQSPALTTAKFHVPAIHPEQMHCLSFWYRLSGENMGYFFLEFDGDVIWSRFGDLGSSWRLGQVMIPAVRNDTCISFKLQPTNEIIGNHMFSEAALDDVSLTPGTCSNDDISCNFEYDLCGWKSNVTGSWSRAHEFNDASPAYLFRGEYYLKCEAVSGDNKKSALISPRISVPNTNKGQGQGTAFCFTFFYRFHHYVGNFVLQLTQERITGERSEMSLHLESTGTTYDQWSKKQVDILITDSVKLYLTPQFEYTGEMFYLDTVTLLQGTCDVLTLNFCSQGSEFVCDDQCRSNTLKCDKKADCQDGRDESPQACCEKNRCKEDEFCCYKPKNDTDLESTQPECIPLWKYCDGYNDCDNWSDENHCRDDVDAECTDDNHLFACDNGLRCVQFDKYVCNGYNDCGDHSDEKSCPEIVLLWTTFGFIIFLLIFAFILVLTTLYYWHKYYDIRDNIRSTSGRTRIANRRGPLRQRREANADRDDLWFTDVRDDVDLLGGRPLTFNPPPYDTIMQNGSNFMISCTNNDPNANNSTGNTNSSETNTDCEAVEEADEPPAYRSVELVAEEQRDQERY